jgi:hypothetical protein
MIHVTSIMPLHVNVASDHVMLSFGAQSRRLATSCEGGYGAAGWPVSI